MAEDSQLGGNGGVKVETDFTLNGIEEKVSLAG